MKRDIGIIQAVFLGINNCEETNLSEVKLGQYRFEQVAYYVNLLTEMGKTYRTRQ